MVSMVSPIFEIMPDDDAVLVSWINKRSGVILRSKKSTVVVDPVGVDATDFKQADAVLITHEHPGHFNPLLISRIRAIFKSKIVAPHHVVKKLSDCVPKDYLIAVSPRSEVEIDGVEIFVEKSNHVSIEPVSYIICFNNGITVFHTSDSLPFPEMKNIGKNFDLDIVFCTVGLAPQASYESGVKIAELSMPRVAIPYHTDSRTSLEIFVEKLFGRNLRGQSLEIFEVFEYKRGVIDELE